MATLVITIQFTSSARAAIDFSDFKHDLEKFLIHYFMIEGQCYNIGPMATFHWIGNQHFLCSVHAISFNYPVAMTTVPKEFSTNLYTTLNGLSAKHCFATSQCSAGWCLNP